MGCYKVSITSPSEYPVYLGIDDSVDFSAEVEPDLSGTYTWSKASGPGGVTFSAQGSSNTNFSVDGPGVYIVQCEFLADEATRSYQDESSEVVKIGIEFLEKGTNSEISECHVGTDGNSSTTRNGETKEIDLKVTPNDITVDFSLYSNVIGLQNLGVSLCCRLERSD